MIRITRGVLGIKKRKRILKKVKGYKKVFRTRYKLAKQMLVKSNAKRFINRKQIKRDLRRLWIKRIGNFTKTYLNVKYSVFINRYKRQIVKFNRKILSELMFQYPLVASQLLKSCMKT